jgi:peptide/nickel transport system permease protein
MGIYVVRRLLSVIPVVLGVSVIVFLFIHIIPGDAAVAMLGDRATAENVARVRQALGLDEPLPVQYALFMSRTLRGDLGTSIHTGRPIRDELGKRFPATIELALAAMAFALAIGIPAGVIAATRHNSWFDNLSMVGALLGVSIPIFWLGLVLAWLFAVQLHWFPFGSRLGIDQSLQSITGLHTVDSLLTANLGAFFDALHHLVLPAFALSTIPMAIIARMTRSSLLEVLGQDYIRTARAKGLRESLVVWKHALKNASLPVVTVVGLQVGILLSGAIMTETIFSWPGIGRWVYDAILTRDYPIVQSVVMMISLVFVLVNLAVDLSYAVLDPRIRYR